MTKKDYEALARGLKEARPSDSDGHEAMQTWEKCVRLIAQQLYTDNNRFHTGRFYDACGWVHEENG